ncbi:flavin reductase family protein [Kitasatospora sp. NPDC059571]|uniref:flavin reductase family protein n=1 Tax=Kitasatospora sp. NPDC059571 TaxID=3346871 RepID=UPI00369BEC66
MTLVQDHRPAGTDQRDRFVAAMGNAATGVTVVATDGPGGRCAQTVSAMCSVSADPPSLLVCVNERSPLIEAVRRNGVFSVNVLDTGQAHVADSFAGRSAAGRPYDFGCADWETGRTGAPVLAQAAAAFECVLERDTAQGTHRVLLGHAVASTPGSGAPLLYHARAYGAHRPITPPGATAPGSATVNEETAR